MDISGLDLSQADSEEAFDKVSHLKYIDLTDTTLSDDIKNIIPKNNLVVCQDEDSPLIGKDDIAYTKCCEEGCFSSNHIVIYYTNDNSDNNFPILLNEGIKFNAENDYSDSIRSIVVNDETVPKKISKFLLVLKWKYIFPRFFFLYKIFLMA